MNRGLKTALQQAGTFPLYLSLSGAGPYVAEQYRLLL